MSRPFDDVRMRGFRERMAVDAVLRLLEDRTAVLPGEPVPLAACAGRVLAGPVVSAVDVPAFDRAAMDGYAVRAADTGGVPIALTLVGESRPARPFDGVVQPGQAVRIMTGAPIPPGADAVLRVEVATAEGGRVLARESVVSGRHIGRAGEDVTHGRTVLPAGRVLRPQDVGLLASIGVATVAAVRRPRVAVLVTGDELLPPGSVPQGYRIVDSNSPMLAALVARDGGECLPVRYLPDRYEAVRDAIRDADADVILVSGGSSVGTEDHAPRAVAELGELAVHGVALRPAGPMGVGFGPSRKRERRGDAAVAHASGSDGVIFLLPGNPVSCLCAYDLFAGRVVRRLGGRAWDLPYRRVALPLAANLTSAVGRVDYVRVRLANGAAEPIAGGASALSTTVAADGFVLVAAERESLAAGEVVEVWLYD